MRPSKPEDVGAGVDAAVELSVVVPVYGCVECLGALVERCEAALGALGRSHEIVLVDDSSPDGSWERIVELAREHAAVRGVRLSRNFGQHAALTAGLAESRGRWVVAMDCDLQDPPEQIPALYNRAQEGYDVVLARRVRRGHPWFRKLAAVFYFWLMRTFVHVDIRGDYGTFSIVNRRVVDEFLRIGDRSRHYLFILRWLGFRQADVAIEHETRYAGKSSYTLARLIRHAFDGLFFQTTVLLRWIVYGGFVVSGAGLALAAYLIVHAVSSHPYPGWTSLAVLILLIGGFIIISTGVAGLYIGKIFEQVRPRPLYVVDRRTEVED